MVKVTLLMYRSCCFSYPGEPTNYSNHDTNSLRLVLFKHCFADIEIDVSNIVITNLPLNIYTFRKVKQTDFHLLFVDFSSFQKLSLGNARLNIEMAITVV